MLHSHSPFMERNGKGTKLVLHEIVGRLWLKPKRIIGCLPVKTDGNEGWR